jgi:hypothetical protein
MSCLPIRDHEWQFTGVHRSPSNACLRLGQFPLMADQSPSLMGSNAPRTRQPRRPIPPASDLLRLDFRRLNDLGPFVGFLADEFGKLFRCSAARYVADSCELLLHCLGQ